MSRWKQYQNQKKKQQKLKNKSYKTEAKIAELLLAGETEKALEVAKTFLIKHPTNVRGWAYKRGVELWIKHIEPIIGKYPVDVRSSVLKILREEWKRDPRLKPEIVLPKINAVLPS